MTARLQLDSDSDLQPANETIDTGAKETAAQVAKANQRDDLARATGDLALYRYYFKAVGVLPSVIFVGFVIVNVFCNSFGRKYFSSLPHAPLEVLTNTPQRFGCIGGATLVAARSHST